MQRKQYNRIVQSQSPTAVFTLPRTPPWSQLLTAPTCFPVQLHTYVAKAAPTTGLRGEPKERLEGLLRVAFASTEAEILKETAGEEEEEETEKGTTTTTTTTTTDDEEAETEKEAEAETGEEDSGEGDGNSTSARQQQDGTTVTACLLVGNLLVTANVGDTTAVLGSVG